MNETSHQFAWGLAMRDQNDDDVVRCDGCDQAGLLTSMRRRGSRAHRLSESADERAAWPAVDCVFRTGCSGKMRREWLN